MDSLKRGLIFFTQAWRLARETPGLLVAVRNTYLLGLAITLLGLVLAAILLIFLPGSLPVAILAGFLAGIGLLAQPLVGYVFSGEIAARAYQGMQPEAPAEDHHPANLRQRWIDLLALAAGLSLHQVFGRRKTTRLAWAQAAYLTRPILVVENLSMREALQQTDRIVHDNLLLMDPSQVGVFRINTVGGITLTAIGAYLGILAGLGAYDLFHGATAVPLSICISLLVTSFFTMAAVALGSLNAAIYHTCLYLWAQRVESSRIAGHSAAPPPRPLAVALAGVTSLSAPIYSD